MAVREGYKQTEVGVIPEDWECVKLKNYVEVNSGESPSKFEMLVSGVPFFKVEQLNNSIKYQKITPYYILQDKVIPRGSLIFPKRGASILLNKIRILNQDSYMDTNLMTLTVFKEDLYNEYLYYLLISIELWRIADTTSIPQINNKHIYPLTIQKPPFKEQKAIATALSDIDGLISSLAKLIKKKKNVKQGAMQELLTGKKRLDGYSGEWFEVRLGDIADIYQPTTVSNSSFTDVGYFVYGANGIVGKYNKYNHEKWQTTITCRGSTCGTVNKTVERCWITGNAMVINFDNSMNLNKLFMYYYLSSQDFSNCITGTGQPQIVRRPLFNFKITTPKTIEEQTAIAIILSDMDSEIEKLQTKLDKYKAIKQGMMQELLTGRIRILEGA